MRDTITRDIEEVHQRCATTMDGALADDIPERTRADPNHFGIALDARVAAAIAVTGDRVLTLGNVEKVLSVMATCGMYDHSVTWVYEVGLPAKSGVAGGLGVLPGQFGVALFSPLLDEKRTTMRGGAGRTAKGPCCATDPRRCPRAAAPALHGGRRHCLRVVRRQPGADDHPAELTRRSPRR